MIFSALIDRYAAIAVDKPMTIKVGNQLKAEINIGYR
jgi:hypothetical protein